MSGESEGGDALEIAVLGDLHGDFHVEEDAGLLEPYPVRLCTGDLAPNGGPRRFDEALRQARELAQAGVHVVLGNHDGPSCFTGRKFPESYLHLAQALGSRHVGGRVVELPEHDLSIVGARPLSCGGPEIRFPVPGRESWTLDDWGTEVARLLRSASGQRIVVLAHAGATGLGERAEDINGCDFRAGAGDWGDPDLRQALESCGPARGRVLAVVSGHMHHRLRGGGRRVPAVREAGALHLNAALVPRVVGPERALFVVRLSGGRAEARLEWHSADGVRCEPVPEIPAPADPQASPPSPAPDGRPPR